MRNTNSEVPKGYIEVDGKWVHESRKDEIIEKASKINSGAFSRTDDKIYHPEKDIINSPPVSTNSPISKRPQRGRAKTQLEYSLECWLESEYIRGRIELYEMQPKPLKLGYRCTYRPDALAIRNGRAEYYEAKGEYIGKRFEDGMIKLKWAADKYQEEAHFYLFTKAKDGGHWLIHIPPAEGKPKPKEKI